MRYDRFFVFGIILVFMIFIIPAMSSPSYQIDSSITSSGGDNASSSLYSTKIVSGIISGNPSSGSYEQEIGFWYFEDTTAPDVIIVSPTNTTYTSSSISFEVRTDENSACNYTLDSGVTNTSMTANSSNTGFTATQTLSNAGYSVIFYCQDTSGNLNNTETVSFTVSVSSAPPVVSSSDSSSSGGGDAVIVPLKFTVSPESYEKSMIAGRTDTGEITIKNKENSERTFKVELQGLEEIISLEDLYLNIGAGKSETFEFDINAPLDPGVYTGKIVVSSGQTRKQVLVLINVNLEKSLFDVILTIPRFMRTMSVGENLRAQVDLIQMGVREKMDVTLKYFVKDFNSKLYLTESETIAVYEEASLEKEFYTAELGAGDYVLGVELVYPDGVAVASSQFKIKEKVEFTKDNLLLAGLSLGFLIVLFAIGFAIKRYKKKKTHGTNKKSSK